MTSTLPSLLDYLDLPDFNGATIPAGPVALHWAQNFRLAAARLAAARSAE